MNSSRRLTALSTALLLTTLSACGGGGGGGGDTPQDPTPRQQLTPLPTFLEAAQSQCTFEEGGQPVSLVDYYGTLANVTSLTCNGATLTNLDGIDLLTAL